MEPCAGGSQSPKPAHQICAVQQQFATGRGCDGIREGLRKSTPLEIEVCTSVAHGRVECRRDRAID